MPVLVSTLLCMRASSQQCLLDPVFGAMRDTAAMVRGVSDRACAKARSHLHVPALSARNDQVLAPGSVKLMVNTSNGLARRCNAMQSVAQHVARMSI